MSNSNSPIIEREPQSVSEVLEALSPTRNEWWNGREKLWMFRGLGEFDTPLIPKAWRTKIDETEPRNAHFGFIRHVAGDQDFNKWKSNLRDKDSADMRAFAAILQTEVEIQSANELVRASSALGLEVPQQMDFDPLTMFKKLRKGDGNLYRPQEITAFAQHYGIPTRLLDWTRNPYIALYFAASDASGREKKNSDFMIVWALSKIWFDPGVNVQRLRHYEPVFGINQFMRAQEGCFTWAENAELYFVKHGRWPDLRDIFLDSKCCLHDGRQLVVKIKIPKSLATELLEALWRLGISRAHLMPSVDNVVKTLEEKWRGEASQAKERMGYGSPIEYLQRLIPGAYIPEELSCKRESA